MYARKKKTQLCGFLSFLFLAIFFFLVPSSLQQLKIMEASKFKEIQHPPTLLHHNNDNNITRRDLRFKSNLSQAHHSQQEFLEAPSAFVLEGVLSIDEARWYIEEAERVGMESLEGIFPKEYRSNHRLLTLSHPAAQSLFRRILPSLNPLGSK